MGPFGERGVTFGVGDIQRDGGKWGFIRAGVGPEERPNLLVCEVDKFEGGPVSELCLGCSSFPFCSFEGEGNLIDGLLRLGGPWSAARLAGEYGNMNGATAGFTVEPSGIELVCEEGPAMDGFFDFAGGSCGWEG